MTNPLSFCFSSYLYKYHYASLSLIDYNRLKGLPGFGWAMQTFVFVFLQRRWEDDVTYMTEVFAYLRSIKRPFQLLIFPEVSPFVFLFFLFVFFCMPKILRMFVRAFLHFCIVTLSRRAQT